MPKIPSTYLDGVFYLYESVASAQAGERYGGTGFFVACPSEQIAGADYIYAVTNWHVAVNRGFSVIRLNKKGGGTEIIDLGPEDWEFDAEKGYDVAVALVSFNPTSDLKFSVMPMRGLATEDRFTATEFPLGVGDDTFMVGRFVDHDGGPTNQPAVRFGHISIPPTKIRSALGKFVDTICLDTNSRTGFSGSPVYVYRTMTSDLEQLIHHSSEPKILVTKHPMLLLLGVHVGQFPEWWDYRSKEENEAISDFSDGQIRGLSGMTQVAPAWAIRDLINSPVFKDQRDASETSLAQMSNSGPSSMPSGIEIADATNTQNKASKRG